MVFAFALVWIGIGAGVGAGIGAIFGDFARGGVVGAVAGIGIALLIVWYAILFGPGNILTAVGAQPADPKDYPELDHLVEALAIGAGLPKPKVYVIDDSTPNALATGMRPDRSAIAVTISLLGLMSREELEGVLAHELSHIRNRDTRLLLLVTTLLGFAGWVANTFWRPNEKGLAELLTTLVVGGPLKLVGSGMETLIELAVSRQREYLADASGVELTRNPAGLLGALRKVAANKALPVSLNPALAPLCFDNPAEHFHGAYLVNTHPRIEDRIAAVEEIAAVERT